LSNLAIGINYTALTAFGVTLLIGLCAVGILYLYLRAEERRVDAEIKGFVKELEELDEGVDG